MNSHLSSYSSDNGTAGIWRALIVQDLGNGKARVFIPSFHKGMNPFKAKRTTSVDENGKADVTYSFEKELNIPEQANPAENEEQAQDKDSPKPNSSSTSQQNESDESSDSTSSNNKEDIEVPADGSGIQLFAQDEYGPEGPPSDSVPSTSVRGIYNEIRSLGYSSAAASAILGNMEAESSFDPTIVGDNGTSYGLCQWHNSRWTALVNWCNSNGLDASTVKGQVGYLNHELTTNPGFAKVKAALDNATDAEGARYAAELFCKIFEVPANAASKAIGRGNNAVDYYNAAQSGTLPTDNTALAHNSAYSSGAYGYSAAAAGATEFGPLAKYPIAPICCWQVRPQFNVGDPVWVMFECGNVQYPVILGQFGTLLSYQTVGGYSGSSGSAGSAPGASGNNDPGALPPDAALGMFMWPSGTTLVTSPYGYRIHPVDKTRKFHTGIDIGAGMNTAVYASADGTAQCLPMSSTGGFGNMVVITHADGYITRYCHLNSFNISSGATVKQGDIIGYCGTTGKSTGPHIHYEIWKDGNRTDPIPYFDTSKLSGKLVSSG